MHQNNLMHKEFLFKIQKMIVSDELTEMLKHDKKLKLNQSSSCLSLDITKQVTISQESITFEQKKSRNSPYTNNSSIQNKYCKTSNSPNNINNNNNDKEIELISTDSTCNSKGFYLNSSKIKEKILGNSCSNSIECFNSLQKNDQCSKTLVHFRHQSTILPGANFSQRNTNNIKSTQTISRRFSAFLNSNLSDHDETLAEEKYSEFKKKFSIGIGIIESNINDQIETLKRRIREKKNIKKYRKISEDQKSKENQLSLKHFNHLHRRNLSNISLKKKKFNEDQLENEDYTQIGSEGTYQVNSDFKVPTYIGLPQDSNNERGKLNKSLFKSVCGYHNKTISMDYSKLKAKVSQRETRRKNKKLNKKINEFNNRLSQLIKELKEKLKSNQINKISFLKRDLEEEFKAKINKAQEYLDPITEFELLKQCSEGNILSNIFKYDFYITINVILIIIRSGLQEILG